MPCILSSLFTSSLLCLVFFFFFNDTATTEIYTLSLHDALPIFKDGAWREVGDRIMPGKEPVRFFEMNLKRVGRSEEHTSELQSLRHLVCRLLLEKKKKQIQANHEN